MHFIVRNCVFCALDALFFNFIFGKKKNNKKTTPRINHDKDSGKKELAFMPIWVACFQIKEMF